MRKKFGMTKIRNNQSLLLICLIALFATVLRLHNLDAKSMWFDEIYSVSYTENPLSIAYDDAPPLYFIALRYWMMLGDTAFVLRLLSAIFGLLMVPLTYVAGRDFFGSKEGLLASAFMAVSLLGIQESQSVRPYTLVGFFGFLSLYSFYKSYSTKKEFWQAIFCLSTIIAIYTHYLAFLILIAESIFVITYRKRYASQIKPFFSSLIILFIAYTPWIIYIIKESGLKGLTVHTHSSILLLNYDKIVLFYQILAYFSNTKYLIPLFFLTILCGIHSSYQNQRIKFNIMLTALIVCLAIGIPSMARVHAKYFMYLLPIYYILSSKGILSIKNKKLMSSIVLLILVISSAQIVDYYNSEIADWRSVAEYICLNAGGDDLILVEPSSERLSLMYYLPEDKYTILSLTESDGTPSKTRKVLSDYSGKKFWVVYTDHNRMKYDLEGKITGFLEERKVNKTEFTWITVYLINT